MLLWCALVISSIRPTRSVVETPWVLLHSLKQHRTQSDDWWNARTQRPIPTDVIITGGPTCTVLTSSPLHTYPYHPLLVLYHLKRQHPRHTNQLNPITSINTRDPDPCPASFLWLSISLCLNKDMMIVSSSTSVHTEVTVVLVEGLEGGDVRRSLRDLIHPFYGPHHLVSFFLSEDGRTLVLCDLTLRKKNTHWGLTGRDRRDSRHRLCCRDIF